MKNYLDLRKKVEPKIVMVEKIITKPRSFFIEALRMGIVILLVTAIGWSLSYADNLFSTSDAPIRQLSVLGVVSKIEENKISLENAELSNGEKEGEFTFDAESITRYETKSYNKITISDLKVGDKVVVQGTLDQKLFIARRVISFATVLLPIEEVVATSTATSTVVTDQLITSATSTDENATSTSTTSPEIIQTASTTEVATSTEAIVEATSSPEVSSSTNLDTAATSTVVDTVKDVIDTVVDTVKDAVSSVVEEVKDIVTSPTENPVPAEETPSAPVEETTEEAEPSENPVENVANESSDSSLTNNVGE